MIPPPPTPAVRDLLRRGLAPWRLLLPRPRPGAGTDALTGLAERAELTEKGPGRLRDATDQGRAVTLLMVDLDGFKDVNDAAGHDVGDRVLTEVGRRLLATAAPDDLVVRMGGDEFAVLTAAHRGAGDGPARAQRLIAALAVPVEVDELAVTVGASVGIAVHDRPSGTLADLVRAADQAMYAAKRAGSGQWRTSRSDQDAVRDEADRVLADLRSGRVTDELLLHYQPQVDARTGAVVGFEALVRWAHPELGLLGPDRFIPLAERSGLMAPVTSAVLDAALGEAGALADVAPGSRLSINVTRRHILGRGLVDDLRRRLDRAGVDPRSLVLEITEPLTTGSRETEATFERLHEAGIGVSIHGFGTSRSSLTALWSNPAIVEIKFPRSVVQDAGASADRLVRAAASAAHGLEIRAVAEGVEHADDVARVRTLGCDVLQGYWIGAPGDLEATSAWVATWPEVAADRLKSGPFPADT